MYIYVCTNNYLIDIFLTFFWPKIVKLPKFGFGHKNLFRSILIYIMYVSCKNIKIEYCQQKYTFLYNFNNLNISGSGSKIDYKIFT